MAGKKAGEPRKDGTPAAKPGPDEHVPTEETKQKAEYLAGLGVPHEHIAVLVGLSDDKTLRKHYADELKLGKAKANAKATQMLFQKVDKGDLGATIFWLKSQAGWREKSEVIHTGPDGGPLGAEALMGAMEGFMGALFGGALPSPPPLIEGKAKRLPRSKKGGPDGEAND